MQNKLITVKPATALDLKNAGLNNSAFFTYYAASDTEQMAAYLPHWFA